MFTFPEIANYYGRVLECSGTTTPPGMETTSTRETELPPPPPQHPDRGGTCRLRYLLSSDLCRDKSYTVYCCILHESK